LTGSVKYGGEMKHCASFHFPLYNHACSKIIAGIMRGFFNEIMPVAKTLAMVPNA